MKIMKNDNSAEFEKLVEHGQFREALALVDALIDQSPSQGRLWADRGWILFRKEDYSTALESFTKALALFPRAASTLFFRAQCREKLGDLVEALNDYHASFDIKPQADVLVNIGLIHRYEGKHDAAHAAFSDALRFDPKCEIALALLQKPDSDRSPTQGVDHEPEKPD